MALCKECIYYPKCEEYPLDESGCKDIKLPTAFVEVVRCKDCIHWDTKTGICFNPAGLSASGVHTANNYCSSGKRKEIA